MILVARSDPTDAAWQAWHERALLATKDMQAEVEKGESPEIDERLYKEAMDYLLALSNGKCVYCESRITTTHRGDVEHYRPKGRIKDDAGRVVKVAIGGQEREHPGYWWLAYEWTNLLPSCIDCNRRRWHDSELGGKGELFPVRLFRAKNPGEETQEEPLLLNPTHAASDPSLHLDFLSDGMIKPKTDIGAESCKILGLNLREPLVLARRERFREAQRALRDLLTKVLYSLKQPSEDERELRRELNEMWDGKASYGAFTRTALRQASADLANRGFAIQFPLEIS